jgi:hypothetical protein
MGFDYRKMPVFTHAMNACRYPLFRGNPESIEISSDHCSAFKNVFSSYGSRFEPPGGWRGFIELEDTDNDPSARVTVAPLASAGQT